MNHQSYTSKQAGEISAKYKDVGNKFFKAGDFHQAVQNYTEALVKFWNFLLKTSQI